MILLNAFNPLSLITPDLGFLFWTLLVFIIFYLLVGKFAIRPILNSLDSRNQSIEESLKAAQHAKLEFENLSKQNEDALRAIKEEKLKMMEDVKKEVNSYREAEMEKARQESKDLIERAKGEIDQMKSKAIAEAKGQIGALAIDIASKVLHDKLEQADYHDKYLTNIQ
ncbi:MAG: F0F1 ATP synthase subunit B [Chitinophagales bacterium]|jgi:F-type H+-transporting ATPase subunit b|nr:F0F1 ATP synthase subunit B [Chitinophagales bacterium]